MDPQYDPKKVEDKIYRLWEESGFFDPDNLPGERKKPYCIIMPPPNANEALHLGHALMTALEDILIRYHRMKGEDALWLPGADHAGFETQVVFERKLEKEGKSRFQFEREVLYKMIWDYVQENKDVARNQLKRLGASCDWSRAKFTLDADIIKIVYETFKKMYDDGLVYRGPRIINWCPKHQTGLSDLEVKYEDREDKLWYIKYPIVNNPTLPPLNLRGGEGGVILEDGEGELSQDYIVVATTRPETMLGDTAVAVNPSDERYKKLVGQKVLLPLVGREILIVADEAVELEFGTGAVKVTPAHDATDFEIGQRHKLETISVIGQNDKMTAAAGAGYAGLKISEARLKVVEDLKAQGFLVKEEPYKHSVGVCYKCGRVIEPLVSDQWFIKIKPLAERAIKAVNDGDMKFISVKYEKIFQHWMANIRDWNISRQIVWGIRIPAWYCINRNCPSGNYGKIKDNPALFKDIEGDYIGAVHHGENYEPSVEHIIRRIDEGLTINENLKPFIAVSGLLSDKPSCPECHSKNVFQEKDTFDTWFSSGQWPFATLMSSRPGDFERFYPTAVMETGWDILFFWVARMVMMGYYATGKEPFKEVYLHGLIRDKDKQKMSKSKGNVINPLAVVDENGADALRMALVFNAASDSDLPFGEDKVIAQKRFANKIWNAARFSLTNLEGFVSDEASTKSGDKKDVPRKYTEADKQILAELEEVIKKITKDLDNYNFHEAAQSAYHFFWHSFCDVCIENVKKRIKEPASTEDKQAAQFVLWKVLMESLKLLHPFMPFITEAIYQEMPGKNKPALIVENWPRNSE